MWLRMLDRLVLFAGVAGPLMVAPQIAKIFLTHNASGVSVISWAAFALFDAPFVIYGIAHKEPPIAITYTLFFFMNLGVVAGAVLYG